MPQSLSLRLRSRRGFSLLEITVAMVIVGLTSAASAGKVHDIMIQQRVARAATAMRNDLEGAFALAVRNRRPIRISWDATAMQLGVTDRAGTTAYRHTNVGRDAYGLTSSAVSFSRSPVEVYPNGLANDTLTITLSTGGVTKRVRMSRAGLVLIQ